ncbi:MAG: Hsp20/alpha crystallin family protein [Siculibacillus sp.]|nr:Hsp20/alpha crystallin family protein [Siculibacillus sp.]
MNIRSLIPFGFGPMPARGADPFGDLRREMDRLFDEFTRGWTPPAMPGTGFLTPKVDLAETEAGLEMTAELPGIDREDIELDITDGVLTLKAKREAKIEEKDEAKKYHLVERSSGTWLRRFPLPFTPAEEKVEATFDKGVLKVVVPRTPEAEMPSKKIEVKAA